IWPCASLARKSLRPWDPPKPCPNPPADEDLDRASEDPKDGDSFAPKMRAARGVASQVVPSSSTTPRSSSAPIAPARCKGDFSEVTLIVAQTRMYMAPRVIATMRMVVTIEATIFFIGPGCDSNIANQRIAQTKRSRQLSVPGSWFRAKEPGTIDRPPTHEGSRAWWRRRRQR